MKSYPLNPSTPATPGVGCLSNGGTSRYLLKAESTTGVVAWKLADGTILISQAMEISIKETSGLTFWSCASFTNTSQSR
jgi:hypothetical protein